MIIKKLEFDESHKFENNSTIKEVFCNNRNRFNILSLVILIFSVVCCILGGINLINSSEKYILENKYIQNLCIVIIPFIIFFTTTMVVLLKLINYRFYINNNEIVFKDWKGRSGNYLTNDIKKVTLHRLHSRYTTRMYIRIEFNDNKKITISSLDNNFFRLKEFFGL